MKKLKTKIETELGYGPEIFNLKSITIGDNNFINKENNGEYSPVSNEINIGVEGMKKYFPEKNVAGINKYIDIKVQMVFDVIFHEYGHHIANSYLNNVPEKINDDKNVQPIYAPDYRGVRVKKNWDNDFLKNFKKFLKYDAGSYVPLKLVDSTIKAAGKPTRFKSIGLVYDQKDLFTISNRKQKPSFPDLAKHVGFDGYVNAYQEVAYKIDKKMDESKIPYYHSMSELFTRKYQQLTMLSVGKVDNNLASKSLLHSAGYNENGWIYFPSKNPDNAIASQLLENRGRYESVIGSSAAKYLQDDPFTQGINLYNIMDKHFGHTSGADISYIWPENNTRRTSKKMANFDTLNIDKKIKFGGYIANKNMKYVGFWDATHTFFTSYKISTNDFTYKYKTNKTDSSYVGLTNSENYFYTTDDWMDVSKIKGKQLFFSPTEKGYNGVIPVTKKNDLTVELKTIRSAKDTGYASTWINEMESRGHYKTYKAFITNGEVTIGDSKWT